jgi:hypothetical protein
MGKLLALALFAFVLLSGVTVIMTIDPLSSRAECSETGNCGSHLPD